MGDQQTGMHGSTKFPELHQVTGPPLTSTRSLIVKRRTLFYHFIGTHMTLTQHLLMTCHEEQTPPVHHVTKFTPLALTQNRTMTPYERKKTYATAVNVVALDHNL